MQKYLAAVVLVVSIFAFSSNSQAAIPPVISTGTNTMWVSAGFGPAMGISHVPSQFLLSQAFGVHFLGSSAGPAFAIDLHESFGHGFIFQVTPRFVYDIQVKKGLAVYVSPSVGLGFTIAEETFGLTVPITVKGKIIFDNRWLAYFQPLGFDVMPLFTNGGSVSVQYEMLFGGGVTF